MCLTASSLRSASFAVAALGAMVFCGQASAIRVGTASLQKAQAKASKVESLSIKQKATSSRGGKGYKLENAWPKK